MLAKNTTVIHGGGTVPPILTVCRLLGATKRGLNLLVTLIFEVTARAVTVGLVPGLRSNGPGNAPRVEVDDTLGVLAVRRAVRVAARAVGRVGGELVEVSSEDVLEDVSGVVGVSVVVVLESTECAGVMSFVVVVNGTGTGVNTRADSGTAVSTACRTHQLELFLSFLRPDITTSTCLMQAFVLRDKMHEIEEGLRGPHESQVEELKGPKRLCKLRSFV